MNMKEDNKEFEVEEISFETINVEKLQDVEEIITPGWGTKHCCS